MRFFGDEQTNTQGFDRRPTSDDRRPTSDDRRPTSDDRRPTSDVRRSNTDLQRPRKSVFLPDSEIFCRRRHLKIFATKICHYFRQFAFAKNIISSLGSGGTELVRNSNSTVTDNCHLSLTYVTRLSWAMSSTLCLVRW